MIIIYDLCLWPTLSVSLEALIIIYASLFLIHKNPRAQYG